MIYDPLYNPYRAQRMTTYARNGMVATSQPLAADVGLEMLKKGGNAIDAAIATAACLTVVEPTSNGIGGDAFAIVWFKDEIYGLNASGPAPKSISIDEVKSRGYDKMPKHGWLPVTVPGAPASWAALSKRFGKLPFKELLQPAIRYAEEGFPVSPILAKNWDLRLKDFNKSLDGEMFQSWFDTFASGGKTPKAGEIWKSQSHADTLRKIADTNAESFYKGDLADDISQFSEKYDGFLSKEDLEQYEPDWVDPISINYRGYDVWEIPPNGQGLNALLALNILKQFDLNERDCIDTHHKQIEAMKLAFADGQYYITDPEYMEMKVEDILSESYAKRRKELIGAMAALPETGDPYESGTVYLASADADGNMVSFIQSNYDGFGSGLVVPNTGIALQNRGSDFSLDPEHPNALLPGKKSYHTIIPGFLTKDNQAVGPFGVMGGYMQPQGHMQVVMNMVDFHLNPQATLDAPRWMWTGDLTVRVEPHFPDHLAQGLVRKGHNIERAVDEAGFGRGQIICRDNDTGVLYGGTESRTDASISCW